MGFMGLGSQSGTCSLQHSMGGRDGYVAFAQQTTAGNVVGGGWKQDVTWGLAPRKPCCTGGKLVTCCFHQSLPVGATDATWGSLGGQGGHDGFYWFVGEVGLVFQESSWFFSMWDCYERGSKEFFSSFIMNNLKHCNMFF